MYGNKEFSDDVILKFGHLSEWLAQDPDLLHVQMSYLAKICLEQGNHALEVLTFLEDALGRGDAISEIENAVAVSFLQWPDVERLKKRMPVPASVERIVRAQWEASGCNA